MTVLPFSAVPVKTGAVLLVMLSVVEAPVSVAAVMSGAVATGAVRSMVTARADKAPLVLPAMSVAFDVRLWTPPFGSETAMA